MGAHDADAVLEIIKAMPETGNALVRHDILKAALGMPVGSSAKLVPLIRTWLDGRVDFLIVDDLGALICNLATGNHAREALELLKQLIYVAPRAESPGPERLWSEPAIRIDSWHYKRILQTVLPTVVKGAHIAVFEILCNTLNHAVSIHSARHKVKDDSTDYSCIWCNSIEHAGQDSGHDVKTLLIGAIRDAAEQLIRDSGIAVKEILSALEKKRWTVFRRLAMHTLRLFPDRAPDEVRNCLTDSDYFDSYQLEPEYSLLAEVGFGRLAATDQGTILGWVEKGPDLGERRAAQKAWDGTDLTDEQLRQYADYWRRDKLRPLRDSLPQEWREKYDALVQSHGEPHFPPLQISTSASWVGEVSPKEARDLEAMDTQELVAFLTEWKPPSDDPRAPSVRGLTEALERAVKAKPEQFALEAARFTALQPAYVNGILSGLRDTAKQNWVARWWSPVLDLCGFVVRQPRDDARRADQSEEQQVDWRWTRQVICQLLTVGLENGPARFSTDCRRAVWNLLEPMTNDPDPGPDDRPVSNGEGVVDYVTSSVNTVRGDAMHTVVRYALWVRQELERQPDAAERLASGLGEMPEVRDVLDRHLDAKCDPSPVIRSVYGQWFPWLCRLDEKWAEARVNAIFPPDEASQSLWNVAWSAYINWCRPFAGVFRILRAQYERAIASMGQVSRALTGGSPDDHLAEHLMVYYWQGHLSLDEPDGMLARFLTKAPVGIRAHAFEFVGRALQDTDGAVPPSVLQRLQSLWSHRLMDVRSLDAEARRIELASFGWWFAAGKFDDTWALEHLKLTLEIGGWAEPDHLVVDRLATMAEAYPLSCVQCLRILIAGDQKGWGVHLWRKQAREVLSTSCKAQDEAARRAARDLISILGARGYLDFGELLCDHGQAN